VCKLQLRWGLKQSCSPCQKLSNGMWHDTYTQRNQGDSRLLVVGSQIGNLIHVRSFGHNLCFKYPNWSHKPISDIYVPRFFQWYKKLLNPMSFDPCDRPLKVRESIGTLIPKVGVHLGVWGFILSHSPALLGAWNVTPELQSWPTSFASPCVSREPKVKVATLFNFNITMCYVFIHNEINNPSMNLNLISLNENWSKNRCSMIQWFEENLRTI
jgi:hypothetical protein